MSCPCNQKMFLYDFELKTCKYGVQCTSISYDTEVALEVCTVVGSVYSIHVECCSGCSV